MSQLVLLEGRIRFAVSQSDTNFIAKKAEMFKLKEILKFFPFARISTVAPSLGIWLKLANAGRIANII